MSWANIDSLKTVKSDHLHLKSLDLRDQWIRRWKDWDIWEIMICHSRETREVNSIRWHSLLHRISSQILGLTLAKAFPTTKQVLSSNWNIRLHWSWLSYCQTTYDDQNKLTKHFLKLFCSDMYNRDTISDWEKKAFTFRFSGKKTFTTTDF